MTKRSACKCSPRRPFLLHRCDEPINDQALGTYLMVAAACGAGLLCLIAFGLIVKLRLRLRAWIHAGRARWAAFTDWLAPFQGEREGVKMAALSREGAQKLTLSVFPQQPPQRSPQRSAPLPGYSPVGTASMRSTQRSTTASATSLAPTASESTAEATARAAQRQINASWMRLQLASSTVDRVVPGVAPPRKPPQGPSAAEARLDAWFARSFASVAPTGGAHGWRLKVKAPADNVADERRDDERRDDERRDGVRCDEHVRPRHARASRSALLQGSVVEAEEAELATRHGGHHRHHHHHHHHHRHHSKSPTTAPTAAATTSPAVAASQSEPRRLPIRGPSHVATTSQSEPSHDPRHREHRSPAHGGPRAVSSVVVGAVSGVAASGVARCVPMELRDVHDAAVLASVAAAARAQMEPLASAHASAAQKMRSPAPSLESERREIDEIGALDEAYEAPSAAARDRREIAGSFVAWPAGAASFIFVTASAPGTLAAPPTGLRDSLQDSPGTTVRGMGRFRAASSRGRAAAPHALAHGRRS